MTASTDIRRPLLTAHQVAELLGISLRQVRRLQPTLGAFKVGRLTRFDPDRLDAYLAEQMAAAQDGEVERTTP